MNHPTHLGQAPITRHFLPRLVAACGLFLLLAATASAQGPTENFGGRSVAAREVLVRLKSLPPSWSQILQQNDIDKVRQVGNNGLLLLRSRSRQVQELINGLVNDQSVSRVEPNYVLQATISPNDTSFSSLWGLQNTGQTISGVPGTPGADIHAASAWDIATGSKQNTIAVIDSGIDYNHPDLAANIWSAPTSFTVTIGGQLITCPAGSHGFNAITNSCDPMDDHYHGTHVAGTIGAVANNAAGVSGVNWTASIMGLKFLDSTGNGTTADAIDAIDFAVQAKQIFGSAANIRVMNASWGGSGYSQALLDAIQLANTNDMLFVAAAGNSNSNNDAVAFYPANFNAPNLISVAATTNTDARASFSNYGATTVDLGAPGLSIVSTIPGGSYGTLSGTSMATPHVAGAALLVLSACNLTTSALRTTLLSHVDPIPSMAGMTTTGGRLNVNAALQSCAGPQSPDFLISATPISRTVAMGTNTTYTLSVAPKGGFNGTVNLSLSGLPSGVTGNFSANSIFGGSGSSTLTIQTAASVPSGTYTLGVTATSGALVHPINLTLIVTDIQAPVVTVHTPNGGENTYVNSPYWVAWAASDNVGVVSFDVLLSTDGGLTFPITLASNLPGTATAFNWTPTAAQAGSNRRIRVVARDAAGNAANDASNGSFNVLNGTPAVTVTTPNTAVNMGIGTQQTIGWTSNLGNISLFDIDVSRDGGATYTNIAVGVTGSYKWTVTGPATTTARIRVKSTNNSSVADTSDVNFTIANPFLTVTTPNTGAVNWGIGTTQSVTWSSNLGAGEKVNVLLSTDGGATFPTVLASNVPANGAASFTVPNLPSGQARVQAQWAAAPAVFDNSDANFTIAAPFLTLTSPNGGNMWAAGSTQSVVWSSNLGASESISLELSTDGGASWQMLKSSTPSDGVESIAIASTINSANCLVRMTWLKNPSVTDASNAVFTIAAPALTLTSPNGGNTWFAGNPAVVTWTSNIGGNVELDWSPDNGVTWNVLVASAANSGSRSVTVPNQATSSALVRVTSLAAGMTGYTDTGNAVFTIASPTITIVSPNGGEHWATGVKQNIQWTGTTLGVGNVKIDISRDGGTTWTSIAAIAPNTGSYSWLATTPASANCLIRVSSISYPAATDVSDAVFSMP